MSGSDRDKLIAEASGWNAMIGNPLARIHMTNAECAVASKAIETALALVAELVRDTPEVQDEAVRDTPRVVTTVAELDALPDGSVIQGSADMYPFSVFAKDANRGWEDRLWWSIGSDLPDSATHMLPMAPFTVLFTPTSKETEGAAEFRQPLEGGTP